MVKVNSKSRRLRKEKTRNRCRPLHFTPLLTLLSVIITIHSHPISATKPFPIFIPCPYTENPIPSNEQDEHSQLHHHDLFAHHSRRSDPDNTAFVDPPDSSPISIQRRQTPTEEIERSQQNPVKVTLNTETVALIVEVVRAVLREEPNKLPQGGPAGPPGPLDQVVSGHNVADLSWNAAELGFYDPNYENISAQTASDSEHSVRNTYFRDVHTFIQRAKEFIHTKDEHMVRDNLSSCLRGIALKWYTAELSPDIKSLIRYGTGIDEWEKQLLKRFRLAPHIAMMMVVNERYPIEDARRHREPGDFTGNIMRAAKDAELTSPISILSFIYNGMDAEFQQHLPVPSSSTSIASYFQIMDERKTLWWTLASRVRFQDSRPYGFYSNASSSCYAKSSNSEPSFYQETRPRATVPRAQNGRDLSYNHLKSNKADELSDGGGD